MKVTRIAGDFDLEIGRKTLCKVLLGFKRATPFRGIALLTKMICCLISLRPERNSAVVGRVSRVKVYTSLGCGGS